MSCCGWAAAPAITRDQVARLVAALYTTVGPDCSGVYLHGSLAMGCFNPARSNLDLLAVVDEGMTVETKGEVAALLLDHYLASILGDFADARDAIVDHPVYGMLNLCRVYCYVRDGQISSKAEAGRWAVLVLPAAFRPLVRHALAVYEGTRQEVRCAPEDLLAFAHYVDGRVQTLCRSLSKDGRR